jgi:hypothetical protein
MQKSSVKKIIIANALWLAVFILTPFLFIQKAQAADILDVVYIRLDRLKAATPTTGLVCAEPGTTSIANVDVQVTFPTVAVTDFTLGIASTWEGGTKLSTSDIPVGTSAWPGITGATVGVVGHTVTWTYTAPQTLNTGTVYCFRWTDTAALTTGAAGNNQSGSVTTRLAGTVVIDTGSYSVSVITDDQIVISAVVPPLFTFSLAGGNTDTFTTNLSTGVSVTSGKTFTISTNATLGWVAWVRSASVNGLTSASTGAHIDAALTANDNAPTILGTNKGYAVDVAFTDSGTGTGIVSQDSDWGMEFDGNGTTSGGTAETTFRPVAASSGTTDGDTLTFKELASITAIQQSATDYTDTLTVVAAGRF